MQSTYPITTPAIPTEDVPVERGAPEVDPLREVRELAEAISAESRIDPELYLDEVRVPGGGE